jgi:WD40 repeat protein
LAENVIHIFDFQSGELQKTIEGVPEIFDIDGFIFENNLFWNSCGLFSINGTSGLFVWGESEYLPMPLILSGNNDVVLETLMTEDCETVITSSTDRITTVWSLTSGEVVTSLEGGRAFAVVNDSLTYVSHDNAIVNTLLGLAEGQKLYSLGENEQVLSLDWSSDGIFLAYASDIRGIVVVAPDLDVPDLTISQENSLYEVVLWNPSNTTLVSVDNIGILKVWDLSPYLGE